MKTVIVANCRRRFSTEAKDGASRYVMTSALHVRASSVVQFELAMSCDHAAHLDDTSDPEVRLEFSTDHGLTWSLVVDGCWPPKPCGGQYRTASVYRDGAGFPRWSRITLVLPISTWSICRRFPFLVLSGCRGWHRKIEACHYRSLYTLYALTK